MNASPSAATTRALEGRIARSASHVDRVRGFECEFVCVDHHDAAAGATAADRLAVVAGCAAAGSEEDLAERAHAVYATASAAGSTVPRSACASRCRVTSTATTGARAGPVREPALPATFEWRTGGTGKPVRANCTFVEIRLARRLADQRDDVVCSRDASPVASASHRDAPLDLDAQADGADGQDAADF